MESNNIKQENLVGVIGSRGVVSEVVHGKRSFQYLQKFFLALEKLFHHMRVYFQHFLLNNIFQLHTPEDRL